jgi:FMN reductase (NADPH)/FMN reductase [NAD(P)H]
MNPTIDLLMNRKSIRVYSDQPVTDSDKQTILQAAMRAPTAGNMMLYTIIEVTDQALKDRLVVTCDNQPFIARAPFVLAFLADYQRWYDYYLASGVPQFCEDQGLQMRKPQEGDLLLACCDTLIAAHTAVIAAEALGIGSCYVGDILENYEIHRQLFELPRYVLPITLVCFGYPTQAQAERLQLGRFSQDYIVHQNTYRHLQPADLEEMMQPRAEQFLSTGPRKDGIQNPGQFSYNRKFGAEFSVEMSRSVRRMLADWTNSNDSAEI